MGLPGRESRRPPRRLPPMRRFLLRPSCRRSGRVTKIAHLWADLPCSVDHGIIGLMDPAHGPFVHSGLVVA